MIERLEAEALAQFTFDGKDEAHLPEAMRTPTPEFSSPLFGLIAQEWAAFKQGIPPSSEWTGLNAQNPRLLRAFAALDRAEARANRLAMHPEEGGTPSLGDRPPAKNAAEMKRRQDALLRGAGRSPGR